MHVLISSIVDLQKTPNSRLHAFADFLAGRGHRVTVLSLRDHWKHTDDRLNSGLRSRLTVRYLTRRRLSPVLQKLAGVLRMDRLLRSVDVEDVDVHLCYNSLVLGYCVARRIRRYGIATVYDLADDLPHLLRTSPYLSPWARLLAGAIGPWILKRNLQLASSILITAHELTRLVGAMENKCVVLPNGVDTRVFAPVAEKHDGFAIGYVGALREWVDLEPMLRAVKRLGHPDLRVVIVGGESSLDACRSLADAIGVRNVHFTGNVPYQDVPRRIGGFDAATIPFKRNDTTHATCPLKLLEYMSMAKPVICTPLREVERMVGDRVLYADTVHEWEQAIDRLYRSRDVGAKIGRAGREHVVRNFDWQAICERLEQVLVHCSRKRAVSTGLSQPGVPSDAAPWEDPAITRLPSAGSDAPLCIPR